jgi:hypothetical protein
MHHTRRMIIFPLCSHDINSLLCLSCRVAHLCLVHDYSMALSAPTCDLKRTRSIKHRLARAEAEDYLRHPRPPTAASNVLSGLTPSHSQAIHHLPLHHWNLFRYCPVSPAASLCVSCVAPLASCSSRRRSAVRSTDT